MRPATFEVLSNGEIHAPISFLELQRAVWNGQFRMEDFYRRIGAKDWKLLSQAFNRKRLFETIFFGVYAILLFLLGIWLMWESLRCISLERDSSSWPSVIGRITYAQIENRTNNRFRNVPAVGYTYQVGSKKYFRETIYPECCIGGRLHWAQSVIARHPSQSTCRVYYMPSNPGRTVLEPGLAPHSFVLAGCGLMFAYTGLLLFCLSLSIWWTPLGKKPSRARAIKGLIFAASVFVGFAVVAWLP